MIQILHAQCVSCDTCVPLPPTLATYRNSRYDSTSTNPQCDDCLVQLPPTHCDLRCPTLNPRFLDNDSNLCRAVLITSATPSDPDLFANDSAHPFASSMVMWEICNVLAQQEALPWQSIDGDNLVYEKPVKHGRGNLRVSFARSWRSKVAEHLWERLDLRAACVHLIYAACITTIDRPWETEFVIDDRQLAKYLGLNRRKDLSKRKKLALIKYLGQLPCRLQISLCWPQQGAVEAFEIENSPVWHLLGIQHHIQIDDRGHKSPVGLTFRLRAGEWAKYFLNRDGRQDNSAFYQYGTLPKTVLAAVMKIWQKHEGAARMMLWLLFKTKVGRSQPIAVSTLMKVAYGEVKLQRSQVDRPFRKRQIRTFEKDLEILHDYEFEPIFDPQTYPSEIQPLWAKLLAVPNESEAEFEF